MRLLWHGIIADKSLPIRVAKVGGRTAMDVMYGGKGCEVRKEEAM